MPNDIQKINDFNDPAAMFHAKYVCLPVNILLFLFFFQWILAGGFHHIFSNASAQHRKESRSK